ncbi:MAG: glycosyltransferase family 4 protein [Cetobacterium sp.]
MKILHINSYYYTNKIHENFLKKLDKSGIENTCLVPVEKKNINNSFQVGSKSNVEVEKIFKKIDKFLIVSKMLKIKKIVEKKVKAEKFDIIHAHTLFTNGYGAFKIKQQYDIDYIVAVRNTDINVFFKKVIFLRKLGINILKNAKQVIFISESLKIKFFEKYVQQKDFSELEQKSIVIPNGLDDFWIENQKVEKEYFHDDKINLLFVGALDDNKDILGLAESIKSFKLDKEIVLRVVGSGKNQLKIEELSKKYPKKIIYLGRINEKEKLKEVFDKTDIFVMVSKYETLGMVYLEALSQAIPVIYTKGEAIDRMIPNGLAIGVEYKDYSKILESIIKIAEKINILDFEMKFKKEDFKWERLILKYDYFNNKL